ncbi:dihydroorotase [Flavobacterium branchiophilum]|uniref:Dihydroorotase n=1 Tax=Flavobacterium branchiophilum (strain FL-15) TaxID=1034807 RepID=G2Z0T1_FLABF|nr:dihydroorotase [Flavobacterium branchiophilum]CCB69476.1 Dihydroorotase [Flavobacterium branchiophilum FL-15]
MNLILRSAKVIDIESPFHQQDVDVLIEKGYIKNIGFKLDNHDKYEEISLENLHISQGWFDSSVCFGEPGFEDRETIANGLHVAAKSGFTALALQPNTQPVIDTQSEVYFVKSKAQNQAVAIYPIGALTKKSEGKDLAELFDMKNAGAIAFGDYNKNIENPNLLKIALQYTQDFDGLVIAFSEDSWLKGHGVVNEGIEATQLGLKGIPNIAEEIQVARNLFLLEYTGGKLHIPTISTKKSVSLIKEAKAKGLQVTCSVSVHHLVLTDNKLQEFDTIYKVLPPLRTDHDRKALIDGVLDGTIDMITSDHNPIDIEYKKMEFDMAKYGSIGLETAFGALLQVLPLEVVVDRFTASKSVFGIEKQSISIGSKANITLFNPEKEWIFEEKDILSKSKNAIFLNQKMKGTVYGIYHNSILVL